MNLNETKKDLNSEIKKDRKSISGAHVDKKFKKFLFLMYQFVN